MDQNILTTLVMVALMFVAFYLLILRPQRKRQAEQRATLSALQPGSRVLTSTGIYATLVRMGEKQAVIELSPGHQMTVVKHAIVRAVDPADEDDVDEVDDVADDADHGEPEGYVAAQDAAADEAWSIDDSVEANRPVDADADSKGTDTTTSDAGRRQYEG